MIEPTDEDRARARRMWLDARYADPADAPDGPEDVIATARAEGRTAGHEQLRAAVLALADEWDMHSMTEEVWGADNPDRTGGPEWERGYWLAYHHGARRLRTLASGYPSEVTR